MPNVTTYWPHFQTHNLEVHILGLPKHLCSPLCRTELDVVSEIYSALKINEGKELSFLISLLDRDQLSKKWSKFSPLRHLTSY